MDPLVLTATLYNRLLHAKENVMQRPVVFLCTRLQTFIPFLCVLYMNVQVYADVLESLSVH